MSRTYWKVSVFNENAVSYIVKAVNLKEEEAKDMVHQLSIAGIMARASRHKNPKRDYYYSK